MDELVERLNLNLENEPSRETIATVIVESLERVPRPGDTVQTEIGLFRVENMARRRITRVGIQLAPEVTVPTEEES
jgi:CBS domain containing-hemolysin-like protein